LVGASDSGCEKFPHSIQGGTEHGGLTAAVLGPQRPPDQGGESIR